MTDVRPADALTVPFGSDNNGHEPLEAPHRTDIGNAERFVRKHGADLRFVNAWGWLEFDGTRWTSDETGRVVRRAKSVVQDLYLEAGYELDPDERKALTRHALKSESEPSIRRMIELAKSDAAVAATADQFDRDLFLLNVANGTLDLRTFTLRSHDRRDLITKLIPVGYDADARCPTWGAFLERVLVAPDLIRFVQKFCGYSLTGDVSEQVIAFAWGSGANGKSTLINAVSGILGDYARHVPADVFLERRGGETPRTDLARLKGARFVAAVESDGGKRLAEALLKQLTGSDVVTARFLYRDSFEFTPTFKVIIATNHRPRITGNDHAIWRRVRLVPFTITIPPEEQDRELPSKLRAELPGILRWAVDGCRLWREEGLGIPLEVKQATDTYRAEMDHLGAWVTDRCVTGPRVTGTSSGLYVSYTVWCQENDEAPISRTAFARALTERGFTAVRTKAWRGWEGIAVAGPDEEPAWVSGDDR